MFEKAEDWIRKNIKCCACGGTLETSKVINFFQLEKLAIWKCPVVGRIDIPDYKPRAVATVCDECLKKGEKIRYCIEWEVSIDQIKYHDVESLEDSNKSVNQMKHYFGRRFRLEKLLRRSVRQENEN